MGSELINYLSADEKIEWRENVHLVNYGKGEILFKEGTPASSILYIRQGLVKMVQKISGNNSIIINVINRNHFLGIPPVIRNQPYNCTVIALEPTGICFIPKEIFLWVLANNGTFALKFIEYYTEREEFSFNRILTLGRKQVPGRMAHLLLFFAETIYENQKFNLPMTRDELADFIGVSKKSFIRTLMEFNDDGLIELNGREVEIVKLDLLKHLDNLG
jgi:CRP/FNR family transcriptional regulator